jgi:16S rRNA (guanine(966)-N(2))-methyltransferase RsmD
MRITDGELRRRSLSGFVAAPAVRPTARRMRARLFEFLAPRIRGARFLDLCAGSGAVGIEALSRGATCVTFVDCAAASCGVVRANLAGCGVAGARTEVIHEEAADFLRRSAPTRGWDIVYFDPPYAADYTPVLTLIGRGAALPLKGGVLVVEHHSEHQLNERLGILRRWRLIKQGQSSLSFYERRR